MNPDIFRKMDLLKEWLGSTVERELKAALDWTQCTPRVRGNDKYDDDGTSLRIKPSKSHSSFAVQFVEVWLPFILY